MNLNLEEVCLEMSGHCGTSNTDAESREGVERRDVAWRLSDGFLGTSGGRDSSSGARGEPATDALGLDAHTNEASEPEHNGDRDVLDLLRRVRVARLRTETLHPGVGDSVQEDDKAFDKLRGGVGLMRGTVPRPTEF